MKPQNHDTGWEAFYRQGGPGRHNPDPNIVSVNEVFKTHQVKWVLDLGCGDGRHLIFLGRLGYEMYGLDSAPTALELSKKRLHQENLCAGLERGDMSELPWPDEYFDAVISIKVIHHQKLDSIRKTFDEIRRVLRTSGYVLATVAKEPPPKDWKEGHFAKKGPRTYVPLKGHEKGLAHHFFTERELRELLSEFSIIRLHEDASNERLYVFLAQKRQ
jgi:ubiquinone/menaquinone biosynthesis C-methylase UbiE